MQAFVTTNGRSTFEYCYSSLQNQSISIPITIIRDLSWKDALKSCVERCKSPWLLRVDDDFILHSNAIEYIWSVVLKFGRKKRTRKAVFSFRLWQVWTNTSVTGIKVYHVNTLRDIGGFKLCDRGKTDKQTSIALSDKGHKHYRDKSIVGLHSCGTWEEQLAYEKLWGSEKATRDEMKSYMIDLESQNELCGNFLSKINTCKETNFGKFLQTKKKPDRVDKKKRQIDFIEKQISLDSLYLVDRDDILFHIFMLEENKKDIFEAYDSSILSKHQTYKRILTMREMTEKTGFIKPILVGRVGKNENLFYPLEGSKRIAIAFFLGLPKIPVLCCPLFGRCCRYNKDFSALSVYFSSMDNRIVTEFKRWKQDEGAKYTSFPSKASRNDRNTSAR